MLATTRAVAQKYGPKVGAAALMLPFTLMSWAQESTVATQAKAEVDKGKADLLLIAGGMALLAVAVWAAMKVVGMFGRR